MGDIRIVTAPSVYVVGRQAVDDGELGRFLADIGAEEWTTDAPSPAEKLVEVAGRNCYSSYVRPRPGGNAAYIGHILEVGHGSVVEHAIWTLIITGISRSLTHELVRHRVGLSPSQLSQRFVDESYCEFVVPPLMLKLYGWDEEDGAEDYTDKYGERPVQDWVNACRAALVEYESLSAAFICDQLSRRIPADTWIDGEGPESWAEANDVMAAYLSRDERRQLTKRAREAARSVLPNATETRICLTGNARAWRHVVEMRGDLAADLEFVRLAVVLARVFKAEAPNLFADVRVETADDGTEFVACDHRKV